MIWIASGNGTPKRYIVNVCTGNGEASAEVSLNESGVLSGDITKISSMYDMKTMASGEVMAPGFWLDSTTVLLSLIHI